MRDRVHLASEDGNGWQTLFWVGDDGALRVTSGFGGEIHAGAYDLDAELATREPIAIPQVMPAADCAPPEFHTCIDRSGDPRWIAEINRVVDPVASFKRWKATQDAGDRRRNRAKQDALRLLKQHVGA